MVDFKSNTRYGYTVDRFINNLLLPYPPLFRNQLQDAPLNDPGYSLWQGPVLISSGRVIDQKSVLGTSTNLNEHRFQIPVSAPGVYTLEIADTNYRIGNRSGHATMRATFDLNLTDKNPPTLNSLNVLGDGEFADFIKIGQAGEIRFSAGDDQGLGNVSLSYHTESDTTWQNLALSTAGNVYSSALSGLPSEFISLRIIAQDNSGNIFDYTAEPAFRFGVDAPPTAFHLVAPSDSVVLTTPPTPVTFFWLPSSDPDAEPLAYSIRVTGPGIDSMFAAIGDTTASLNIMGLLQLSTTYSWTVSVTDGLLSAQTLDTLTFHTSSSTAVSVQSLSEVPKTFALGQNYPNPFNSTTVVEYDLPKQSRVTLKLYDIFGQEISTVVDEVQLAGRYRVPMQFRLLATGVYFHRLQAGNFIKTRKLLLLK